MNTKTEIYSVDEDAWSLLSDYPFVKESERAICAYAIAYFDNGFILFGGWTLTAIRSKTIARLDLETSNWTKLGDLNSGRYAHGVIYDGQVFLVVGGQGNLKTEKCTLSGNEFQKNRSHFA